MEIFPIDIWNTLIHVLDLKTLAKFALCNKTTLSWCSTEKFWKHKFETEFGERLFELFSWQKAYKLQINHVLKGCIWIPDYDKEEEERIECTFEIDLTDLNPYIDHDSDDNDREIVNFFCDMYIRINSKDGKELSYRYEREDVFRQIRDIFSPYFKFSKDIDLGDMMYKTKDDSIGCHSLKEDTYQFQIGSKLYLEIVNLFRRD